MPRAYATVRLLASSLGYGVTNQLTDVPALRDKDAQEKEEEANGGADPSVEDVRCRLVEEGLVVLVIC